MNALLKALNDPSRRAILEYLKEKDLTAGEIAAYFDMSKPSISHHLDLLRQAHLVVRYRRGQYQYYALQATVLQELLQWLMALGTGPDADSPSSSDKPSSHDTQKTA